MVEESSIAVFAPGLEKSPGWVALTRSQQDELLKATSDVMQWRNVKGLSAVNECLALVRVETILQGSPMNMTGWLRTVYEGSESNARKMLRDFKELQRAAKPEVIQAMAQRGADLMRGMAKVALAEVVTAVKSLPPPETKSGKVVDVDAYITEVRDKIRVSRKSRSKGKSKMQEEVGAKIAFNGLLRVIRSTSLVTSAEQRKWLQRVVGWTMDAQAISGTFESKRIPIPDGVIITRGRPRKTAKKAA